MDGRRKNRSEPAATPSRWGIIGPALLLAIMVLAAYLPALRAGYIWDDDAYVLNNSALRNLDGLRTIWFETDVTRRFYPLSQYYPLVFTGFWIQYHLWELHPLGYHLVNVLLHALGAVLLWRVLLRLKLPGAWPAAAVFAIHPVHVESVAWITELKNVLSGVFYLAALLAYLRFQPLDAPATDRPRSWAWYSLACLLFACALLSKSITCSLPAVVFLLIWWKRDRLSSSDLLPLVPLFTLGLVLGLLTAWMERKHVGAEGPEWTLSLAERAIIAGRALWFYAGKLLLPIRLTFVYPRWNVDSGAAWQYLPGVLVVAMMTGLFLLRRLIGKGPLVSLLVFSGTLFPALGFINIYPMRYTFVADHYQYLASIALIAPAAAGLRSLLARRPWLRVRGEAVVYSLVLATLGGLTWQQARIYENLETLWTDTVAKNPNGWMGLVSLGVVRKDQGRIDEARELYQRALAVYPDAPEAHFNLGVLHFEADRPADAAVSYRAALRVKPHDFATHHNLGLALVRLGQFEEAIRHYEHAIRVRPDRTSAYLNLAAAYGRQERMDEAAAVLRQGLSIDPSDAAMLTTMGRVMLAKGDYQQATAYLHRALKVAPEMEAARQMLKTALATAPAR